MQAHLLKNASMFSISPTALEQVLQQARSLEHFILGTVSCKDRNLYYRKSLKIMNSCNHIGNIFLANSKT